MSTLNAFEQHLVADQIVTEDELLRYRGEAELSARPVLDVLSDAGLATAESLYQKLAQYCELPFVSIAVSDIPETLAQEVPARYATHYGFVPIGYQDDAIVVALSDPLDSTRCDEIRMVLKRAIQPVVSTPSDIEKASRELYGLGADTVEQILSDSKTEEGTVTL